MDDTDRLPYPTGILYGPPPPSVSDPLWYLLDDDDDYDTPDPYGWDAETGMWEGLEH